MIGFSPGSDLRRLSRTLATCFIVGIVVGLAACLFHAALQGMTTLFMDRLIHYSTPLPYGEAAAPGGGGGKGAVCSIAGPAAGRAAVFRTPLGAAIFAIEVLYRDDFEAEGIVPAIIASVTAYSVFITVYGQGHLFLTSPSYPFSPLA